MKNYSQIPFLRILFPFILGIFTQHYFNVTWFNWAYLLILLIILIYLSYSSHISRNKKTAIQLLADVLLFLLANNLSWQTNYQNQQSFYGNLVTTDSTITCLAVLTDIPIEKEKFIKSEVSLKAIKTKNEYVPTKGKVLVYFKKNTLSQNLKAGEYLILKTKLLAIQPPSNPFQFNYKNYLSNKQIYHQCFIDSAYFFSISKSGSLNFLIEKSLQIKDRILCLLKTSGLTKNAFSICSALITGYDEDVDKSVMDAFSHSGTLHILSVSGLHIGLIYSVLSFLFKLIDPTRKYKKIQFLMVSVILWAFALVTGFSAPVLRSVIMFNLFGFGKLFFRNNSKNQLNILLATAFFLLLYNPFFIKDIGFILSFTALAGIILFQPGFNNLYTPENFYLNYIWQSLTASTSATIGTLPITLLYFKQFPIWFAISNLVVVPLTFILMLLALLIVLKVSYIPLIVNTLIDFLIRFMNLFNHKGIGYIDEIDVNLTDAFFITSFLFLLPLIIKYRRYSYVLATLFLLLIWQLIALFSSFNSKTHSLFTVYDIKRQSIMTLKNQNTVLLNRQDSSQHNFSIKPHLISFNNPEINIKPYNYIRSTEQCILVLDKPGYFPTIDPKTISMLVVNNNFNLTQKQLELFITLKTVVIGSTNNSFHAQKTEELCRKFGLNYYNIKNKGAYMVKLK
jgi:competence protein ComEC